MVSKVLLFVAFLGSLQNATSLRAQGVRGLSFQHPIDPDNDAEKDSSDYYHYKKSAKSTKAGRKHFYHKKNKYEVQLEVVVDHEEVSKSDDEYPSKNKSAKRQSPIPKLEFIEVGHKSWKDSKKSGKKSKFVDGKGDGSGNSNTKVGKNAKDDNIDAPSKSKQLPKPPTVSPYPTAPTVSPAPASPTSTKTAGPTKLGSFGVKIPSYTLAYNLLQKDQPKEKELGELEAATISYLYDFFADEFDEDDFTVFEVFTTEIADTNTQGRIVVVSYDKSVARFDQLSMIKPTREQLGSAVAEAFTGLNMIQYEEWLKKILPNNNIFVGSKVQYLQEDEGIADGTRRGIGATGIAASAVAFTLLVAGAVLYKSKSGGRQSDTDKLSKSPGDMTVAGETFAGETFAGETYDGTASVSAASVDYVRRYDDEENGPKLDNLGSIPETSWSDNSTEGGSEEPDYSTGIAANNTQSAFRERIVSAPRAASFEDVALQAPTYDSSDFDNNIMQDVSSSEDDESQMSDSELSHFVASTEQVTVPISGDTTHEIKSLLSMDSMDENASAGLSVRDNSSRRLRTVAEIEALLSSELNDVKTSSTSETFLPKTLSQQQTNRPRTVEEIESLLTADDDETIVELPFSDEDESILE